MSLADHHDIASHGEAPFDIARGNLAPALCRLLGAVPFAAMLAATVVPGSAFAQCATPDTVLCAKQTADQARLLSPFNLLRNTAAGVASLNANLQTDNGIYLNPHRGPKNSLFNDPGRVGRSSQCSAPRVPG